MIVWHTHHRHRRECGGQIHRHIHIGTLPRPIDNRSTGALDSIIPVPSSSRASRRPGLRFSLVTGHVL